MGRGMRSAYLIPSRPIFSFYYRFTPVLFPYIRAGKSGNAKDSPLSVRAARSSHPILHSGSLSSPGGRMRASVECQETRYYFARSRLNSPSSLDEQYRESYQDAHHSPVPKCSTPAHPVEPPSHQSARATQTDGPSPERRKSGFGPLKPSKISRVVQWYWALPTI